MPEEPRISGVPPITTHTEYEAIKTLQFEVENVLEVVVTPELRADLLDMQAMYRAALDGWEASR